MRHLHAHVEKALEEAQHGPALLAHHGDDAAQEEGEEDQRKHLTLGDDSAEEFAGDDSADHIQEGVIGHFHGYGRFHARRRAGFDEIHQDQAQDHGRHRGAQIVE